MELYKKISEIMEISQSEVVRYVTEYYQGTRKISESKTLKKKKHPVTANETSGSRWDRSQTETPQLEQNTTFVFESNVEADDLSIASTSDNIMTPCQLKVCRVCFAMDSKLYPMMVYKKLDKAYKMLTGLSIRNENNLPPYLCTDCAHRLLDCIRFRARSLRSHLIILEIFETHNEVTLESIKSAIGERKIDLNSSVTHNQTDHNNIEKIAADIKSEEDMISNSVEHPIDNGMVYLPAMDECVIECDIKDEMDTQDSLDYEYKAEEDTRDDDVMDQIKIEIENITKDGKPYCLSSDNSTVNKDCEYTEISQELPVSNDNKHTDETTSHEDVSQDVRSEDENLPNLIQVNNELVYIQR